MEGNFPSFDYFDLTPELLRINIEGTYIEQEKLFDLKSSLITIVECVEYISKQEEGNFLIIKKLLPNKLILIKTLFNKYKILLMIKER